MTAESRERNNSLSKRPDFEEQYEKQEEKKIMREKNYKTQEMAILRVENGQVPGLGQAQLLQARSHQERVAGKRHTRSSNPWASQGFANPGAPFPVPLAQSLFLRLRWFPQQ